MVIDATLSRECLAVLAPPARLSLTILLSRGVITSACNGLVLLDNPLGLQYAAANSMSCEKFCTKHAYES